MGNAHGKEAGNGNRRASGSGQHGGSSAGAGHHGGDAPDRSRRASSRPDLGGLSLLTGGGSSSSRNQQADAPFERRETKQEREARRLERERVARVKERERSMKEEHVDGGFLVTMGVYTAIEDFSKPVVRQLQIERKIAPFWRGLDDWNSNWAEHQIIAAARGLDIPPADVVPDNLVPQPPPAESSGSTSQSINSLTVPLGPRTLSAASDKTSSNPGSSLPSPTSAAPPRTNSPLKPHKALAAALSISSRNGSQQDMAPREINLPNDPFVNGQPLEVFLYKECVECPICCMHYPRFLNKTRCCDQFICSECFVQIKRPDPHLPEHHGDGTNSPAATPDEITNPSELVMEPACCPYCTQIEFGVTYEAPPFRRGLTYAFSGLSSMGTAMSSTTSLNSNLSPTSATAPSGTGRRRTESLSANAPGVISTDRVRPDWSTKLATARAQQRRRAAAADALHHAAFVMGNNDSARTIFGRPARFSRRNTREGTSGSANSGQVDGPSGAEPGARTSSARTGPSRERIDAAHLESMMMAEAIRLSLADEEERRKKAEKEARKEAKKKEKEERKVNRRKSSVYGDGPSSASASSLSLSLGFGRKRGNSAAGNLRMEAAANASASALQSSEAGPATSAPGPSSPDAPNSTSQDIGKGKGVDRGEGQNADTPITFATTSLPIPIAQACRGSHLRQMSNASSVSSSGLDSLAGSFSRRHQDPRTSGLSIDNSKSDDEGTSSAAAGAESMFNFNSLAKVIGVPIDDTSESVQASTGDPKAAEAGAGDNEHVEHVEEVGACTTSTGAGIVKDDGTNTTPAGDSTANGKATHNAHLMLDTSNVSTAADAQSTEGEPTTKALTTHSASNPPEAPELTITPETPVPLSDGQADSKQLGDQVHGGVARGVDQITQ